MPLISVIVPTLRVGGLDILFAGLEQQTFKDFELVLVDCLWNKRQSIVAEKASQYHFPIRHVEPRDNPFPLNSYQRCVNTGLVNASGPISYFTCDYSWLPPGCLQEHADFHQARGPNHAMLGVCHLLGLPLVSPGFPARYGLCELGMGRGVPKPDVLAKWDDDTIRHSATREWCDSYCQDLSSGLLDRYMWSIFEKPFQSNDNPLHLPIIHEEMKKSKPEGFIEPQFCHLKNDSIPTELLLLVNGFDERYDGSHGWQDSEVSDRLFMRLGTQWYLKPTNIVHITDVHDLMIIRKMLRSERANEQLYLTGHATGYADPVNPELDIRGMRLQTISAR